MSSETQLETPTVWQMTNLRAAFTGRTRSPRGVRVSGSLEDIARRCFEGELGLRRPSGCGCLTVGLALLMIGPGWALVTEGERAGITMLLIGVGILVVGRLMIWGGTSAEQKLVSHRMKAFFDGEPDAVQLVHGFAAEEFRQQIQAHRARTVGRDSEWAVARRSLRKTADDAHRSVAYWRSRVRQEPDNPMVVDRLRTATELEAKLCSALDKLDARAEILREFYSDCEARIAVMDRHSQDIEENRRLEALSESADVVIADAAATLAAIGAGFMHEARRIGKVLGEFERLQIKSLAGGAPLDDMEYLADRIIECFDSEVAAVEQLKKVLN